jgi:hypothetical protein
MTTSLVVWMDEQSPDIAAGIAHSKGNDHSIRFRDPTATQRVDGRNVVGRRNAARISQPVFANGQPDAMHAGDVTARGLT